MVKHCKSCGVELTESNLSSKGIKNGKRIYSNKCNKCIYKRRVEVNQAKKDGVYIKLSLHRIKDLHKSWSRINNVNIRNEKIELQKKGFIKCTKCNKIKPLNDFYKRNDRVNSYKTVCITCVSDSKRNEKERYNEEHKEEILEAKRIKEERAKINNRIKRNEYKARKKATDPLFKLKAAIRNRISRSLKKKNHLKTSKTQDMLGCSFDFFKTYLESKFTEEMNWDNYGDWHLDHIIPSSSAKTEEELIILNYYTNFQPLWAEENIKKSDKIIDGVQLSITI